MTTYTIRVTNWRPTSWNIARGRHWRSEYDAKNAMAQVLGWAKRLGGVPDITAPATLHVHVVYSGRQRKLDEDNLTGKLFRDALVLAHLLVDDSPAWVRTGAVTQTRGKRTETTIVLETEP